MKYLFFDTETTGVPKDYRAPIEDLDNWPRLVQLAYLIYEDTEEPDEKALLDGWQATIKPEGFVIPDAAIEIHGITNEIALEKGFDLKMALYVFKHKVEQVDIIIGHNISFDRKVMGSELIRADYDDVLHGKPRICTMMKSTKYCAIPNTNRGGFKWPKLKELHQKLFGYEFEGAHDALADIEATVKCFFELRRLGVITDQDIEATVNKVW
jgi:DNA polymerase-3 subunit epsilon